MPKTVENFAPTLIATVIRTGGCTLRTLLNEAKKANLRIGRADILVVETDEELAMAPELQEHLDMLPYRIPAGEGEEAKLRVFFVPKGTEFMTSGDDDEGAVEGDADADADADAEAFDNITVDLQNVDQFFMLSEPAHVEGQPEVPPFTKMTAEAFGSPEAALGAYLSASAQNRMAQLYAATPIELRFEARRAFPLQHQSLGDDAGDEGDDDDTGEVAAVSGEAGDADDDGEG